MKKLKITSVKAIEKYKIFVSFNDETKGVYDVSSLAGKGVFKTWEEDDNFFKVFINSESGAITWPNDIDIDTYNMYCNIKKISPEEYFNKTHNSEYASY